MHIISPLYEEIICDRHVTCSIILSYLETLYCVFYTVVAFVRQILQQTILLIRMLNCPNISEAF